MRRSLVFLGALALMVAGAPAADAASGEPGTLTTFQRPNEPVYLSGAADGALLVAGRGVILRVAPDRSSYAIVAGTGVPCDGATTCGADGPATTTAIAPGDIVQDPRTGTVYFVEGPRVRKVEGGQVSTVVNASGTLCPPDQPCGDGGPAAAATMLIPQDLGVGPDGSLWFLDYRRVRRVAPDGKVSTETTLSTEGALAVAPDGRVALLESTKVRILDHGAIRTLADRFCSIPDPCGDDGTAAPGFFSITSGAFDAAGDLYLGERQGRAIRRLTPDGRVTRVAGSFVACGGRGDCDEGAPAQRARLDEVQNVAVAGDDVFGYIAPSAFDFSTTRPRIVEIRDAVHAPALPQQRYRFLAGDGGVFDFGWAPFWGSTGGIRLNQPIVGGAARGAGGYWLVAADGGIFTFGNAGFHGSAVGQTVSGTAQPVVAMAATPSGKGYYILERSGFVHAFGDAVNLGNGFANGRNKAVGIAADPDGDGYWIVFDDGTVTANAAPDRGSVVRPNKPIVGIAGRPGGGYWLVASDGGVFAFGDAAFHGSTGAIRLNQPVVGMVTTPSFDGYWLVAADGGVFTFGDAEFMGSTGNLRLNRPVVTAMSN